jgi:hypothetical protein
MTKVMLIRLLTGEDVIGTITDLDGGIHIQEPMLVFVNFRNNQPKGVLQLSHWLPVQLIKSNEAFIKHDDILAIMEPEEQFLEYYEGAVSKVKSIIEANVEQENLNDEQIHDILESLDISKDQIYH